jgi:hypothetical protein
MLKFSRIDVANHISFFVFNASTFEELLAFLVLDLVLPTRKKHHKLDSYYSTIIHCNQNMAKGSNKCDHMLKSQSSMT